MLPRPVLPRRLDPRYVAIKSPTDLPLCWLGIPFQFSLIEDYATNTGLGVPVTEGYWSRIPDSMDVMKTWLVITDNFYEDSGIKIDIREVWGAEHPIITFISNRQTCDITMDQHHAIEDILADMGVEKEEAKWFLDRRELVCCFPGFGVSYSRSLTLSLLHSTKNPILVYSRFISIPLTVLHYLM